MKRIVCWVLLLLLLGLGTVAVWQRDNIAALITGLRYSQEDLEGQLQQNDQTIKDALETVPDVTIRDLTEEDKQALKDGTKTKEEIIQDLIKPVQPEQAPDEKVEPAKPGPRPEQPEVEEPKPTQPAEQEKVAAIIAEIYVLRQEFLLKLDNLMAQAMAEYKALSPEARSGSAMVGLVKRYLATGLDMEKQCDAQIEEIIVRLEAALQESGGDLSVAQTVYDTYVNEKSLKKAWYMAELKKRGLI